jgi:hypothetical protein
MLAFSEGVVEGNHEASHHDSMDWTPGMDLPSWSASQAIVAGAESSQMCNWSRL